MQGVITNVYSRLARQAAEHFVKQGDYVPLSGNLPSELLRQQACYVSIVENPGRRLRSMAGHVMPQRPVLAEEIVVNTVKALQADPARRIRRPDLPHLRYSVALLGPLQRIGDPAHLDPEHFGLYIRSDQGRTGLLLPQRAGVETPDDQIATALRESGIDPSAEAVTMYRFEVTHDDG